MFMYQRCRDYSDIRREEIMRLFEYANWRKQWIQIKTIEAQQARLHRSIRSKTHKGNQSATLTRRMNMR